MLKLSVCLLTCNSSRLLREVLPPLLRVADEFIVVDSGSTDATLQICQQFGLSVHHHPYTAHGTQMNYATSLARHDWVLCVDSDEILDDEVVAAILALKAGDEPDPACAWRLPRYWFVLGEEVRTIYPVSSPDFPVRLFNRSVARFNDRPVDDQVVGFTPNTAPPSVQPPRNPFRGVKQCKSKRPPEPVNASRFFTILSESITQSTLVQYYQLKWQGWDKPTN